MTTLNPTRLQAVMALLEDTDFNGAELYPLSGDASFRRYIRVEKAGCTAMVMDAPPEKEDVRPFVTIAECLSKQGYSSPTILARNISAGLLLLEDFGDDSFSSVVKREIAREPLLYTAAIDVLAQWYRDSEGCRDSEASRGQRDLTLPAYNHALLMKEISLFTDWYLPQIMGIEQVGALRSEYDAIWSEILRNAGLAEQIFVHRDYHADNLMWLPTRAGLKRVGLLDFQDAVCGDPAYDVVSLLEDARRDVSPSLVEQMLAHYIAATGVDSEHFRLAYCVLGAQRNSKIIGIFSRLAARDHKLHYLNYLPRVWRHLERDLTHPILQPLQRFIDRHVPHDQRGVIAIKSNTHLLSAMA